MLLSVCSAKESPSDFRGSVSPFSFEHHNLPYSQYVLLCGEAGRKVLLFHLCGFKSGSIKDKVRNLLLSNHDVPQQAQYLQNSRKKTTSKMIVILEVEINY